VVDELVRSAEWALSGYCATTTKWSFGICINIVQALERRREQLARSYHSLRSNGEEASLAASQERSGEVRRLAERVQLCGTLRHELEVIAREITKGFHRTAEVAT
jgi:hypothetical protein